jgi:hypothetical protein
LCWRWRTAGASGTDNSCERAASDGRQKARQCPGRRSRVGRHEAHPSRLCAHVAATEGAVHLA